MTDTTKAPTRAEALVASLEALQTAGTIGGFTQDKASDGSYLTTLTGADGVAILERAKTPVVEAFVLGTRFAPAKAKRAGGGGVRKPNPYREAIEATGTVEVELGAGEDVKTERNKIFLAAYSLGLKGAFKVETTRKVGGKDGNEVTGYVLRGFKK